MSALVDVDGYPPLEHLGFVGDGATAALIARDATVVWLCPGRFDADPLFCSLLDARRGGSFRLGFDGVRAARQHYEGESAVLVTELDTASARVRVTDCLTVHPGSDLATGAPAARGELLRSVVVLDGRTRCTIDVAPRGGATAERRGDGVRLRSARSPDLDLQLAASLPLDGLTTDVELGPGAPVHVSLQWGDHGARGDAAGAAARLEDTIAAWRRWSSCIDYRGPQEPLVRRSALVLKLLDYLPTGALVAAPTSSLPEAIGGDRNWDYRYAWVRDAAFSVYALRRIGLDAEARAFLAWVLDAVEQEPLDSVMYDVDGCFPPEETIDAELEGYRRSPPVRWGNAAAGQRQHDVWGEILDCAHQWAGRGGTFGSQLWARLTTLVERAATAWDQPDHGIWEVRTPGRTFTYSAAMCQVALDRGARLARRLGLPGDHERWSAGAEQIRAAVLDRAWDPTRNALNEHLGGGGLDASVLSLPLRRVVDARHPRMVATVAAVERELRAGDGLLYRYLPEVSPDGLDGHEGAFLLCSFWLVDNLAKQGRVDEAVALYDSLCTRASPLGLLPEEIDPSSGAFLGNFPQAFSHVGVISSGVNLAGLVGEAAW